MVRDVCVGTKGQAVRAAGCCSDPGISQAEGAELVLRLVGRLQITAVNVHAMPAVDSQGQPVPRFFGDRSMAPGTTTVVVELDGVAHLDDGPAVQGLDGGEYLDPLLVLAVLRSQASGPFELGRTV